MMMSPGSRCGDEVVEHVVDDRGRHHHPDGARLGHLRGHLLQRRGADRAGRDHPGHGLGVADPAPRTRGPGSSRGAPCSRPSVPVRSFRVALLSFEVEWRDHRARMSRWRRVAIRGVQQATCPTAELASAATGLARRVRELPQGRAGLACASRVSHAADTGRTGASTMNEQTLKATAAAHDRRRQGPAGDGREQPHRRQALRRAGHPADARDAARLPRHDRHRAGAVRRHLRRDPLRRDDPQTHLRRRAVRRRRWRRRASSPASRSTPAPSRWRCTTASSSPRAWTACASAWPSTRRWARASPSGAP